MFGSRSKSMERLYRALADRLKWFPIRAEKLMRSPLRVVIFLTILIFLTELLIMGILERIPWAGHQTGALLDSLVLVLLLFPVFYFFLFRPMSSTIESELALNKALRESEERYRLLTETADEGIYILGSTGFEYVNPAFQRTTGYPAEKLLRKDFDFMDLIHPDDKDKILARTKAREEGRKVPSSYEFRLVRRDNEVRDLDISTVELPGQPWRVMGIYRDITERKWAEEAFRLIVKGTAGVTGEDFFHELVYHLTAATEVHIAFIAKLISVKPKKGRTFGIWIGENLSENFEWELTGTPCEQVVDGNTIFFSENVQTEFPEDKWLSEVGAESYLGVPLIDSSGKVIGHMGILDKEPMVERQRNEDILRIFAARAGAELERKQAEERLIESERQLRSLAAHLASAREETMIAISRDLHDELGQILTGLKMDAAWLMGKIADEQQPLKEKAESIVGELDNTMQVVKRITARLRPVILDDQGLVPALQYEVQEFEKRTGIECRITIEPPELATDKDHSTALYRILQESLTNIRKYARASKVVISLKAVKDRLLLVVQDNGIGITEEQTEKIEAYGLLGMRERVLHLDGEIDIRGTGGQGTQITVALPVGLKD